MFQAGAATPPPPSPSYASFSDGAPGVPAPPLYLVFDNQKYRIDKDQFIIGRGAKSSDLPIKDGNISRKHAAVIRRNGTYFIKDLGLDQRHRLQGHAHRQQAHRRRRRVPPL